MHWMLLSGSPVFEEAARRSLRKLWSMRSPLGLLGTSLDMMTGQWLQPTSGTIGASSDSFYEYLLKAFILFGKLESLLSFVFLSFPMSMCVAGVHAWGVHLAALCVSPGVCEFKRETVRERQREREREGGTEKRREHVWGREMTRQTFLQRCFYAGR
jgi:hypothetical protein